MSLRTPLTDRLDVSHPVVQAPIGSATTPELAAAVTDAGGLGHLAVTWRDADATQATVRETRERTDGPFAVNLAIDDATGVLPVGEHLDAVLAADPPVVSLSFGDATPYLDRVHDAGALALVTVGSAAEAERAAEAGADAVVAQGWEAGGHVQSEVATTPLVPRVADAVDVPVVAAGGIADGRGLAAALALGADGAWLGTRFLATEEADVHRAYRRRVLDAAETDTRHTDLFDKGWPGRPHRVLANETIARWERAGRPPAGERPGEDDVVARTGDGEAIERYDEALATPDVSGDVGAMALFAGQSAGLTGSVEPAGEVVTAVVAEAEERIDALSGVTEPVAE